MQSSNPFLTSFAPQRSFNHFSLIDSLIERMPNLLLYLYDGHCQELIVWHQYMAAPYVVCDHAADVQEPDRPGATVGVKLTVED